MAKGRQIIKMAVYTVKKNKLKVVEPAVRKFVRTVNKEEPGTILYSAYQKKGKPEEFVHLMVFKDKKAEKHHSKTAHVRKFIDVMYPNASKEPVFIDLSDLK